MKKHKILESMESIRTAQEKLLAFGQSAVLVGSDGVSDVTNELFYGGQAGGGLRHDQWNELISEAPATE